VDYPGWLGLGFGPTMNKTDMILMRKNSDTNKTLVEDRFSISNERPPILDTDNNGQRNVFLCYGGREANDWNITILRPAITNDVNDVPIHQG